MNFTVPQFIERETPIVGPLTFRQFIYIGAAGVISFIVYFSAPFYIFIITAIAAGVISVFLAFVKIGGRSLPVVLQNFLLFSVSSKMYLWKKGAPPKILRKEAKETIEEGTGPEKITPIAISGESQLKKLSTRIETKIK